MLVTFSIKKKIPILFTFLKFSIPKKKDNKVLKLKKTLLLLIFLLKLNIQLMKTESYLYQNIFFKLTYSCKTIVVFYFLSDGKFLRIYRREFLYERNIFFKKNNEKNQKI